MAITRENAVNYASSIKFVNILRSVTHNIHRRNFGVQGKGVNSSLNIFCT